MYIANNETMVSSSGILSYMPQVIRRYMYGISLDGAYEIRLRIGKPVTVCYSDGRYFISSKGLLVKDVASAVKVTRQHIEEALELASKSSVYSVEEEIRSGYITISGGNRIGLCGSAVMTDGKISFIKDISSLNYRLACDADNASDKVWDKVCDGESIRNTLVISPPGAGKTTLLRDLSRRISQSGFNVTVVDERCEIAAMHEGKPSFDIGAFTDVLSGVPKSAGMLMALRSMAPDVIVTDEIGKECDVRAIEAIINSGVKIITSVHGYGAEQIEKRNELSGVMRFFETVIVLSKRNGAGTVETAEVRKL